MVCGVIEVARGAPSLRGRDAEIQRMDQLIVQTQAADRNARRNLLLVALALVTAPWPRPPADKGMACYARSLKRQMSGSMPWSNELTRLSTLWKAYRHLRIEHSVGVAGIWSRFESGEIPASEIKARVVQALHEELDGMARAEWTEEAVQAKAMLSSQGKRGIGNAEPRRSCLQGLRFDGIFGCEKIAQAPCALSSLGGNPPGSSSTESDLKEIGCSMFSPVWWTLPTASRCILIRVPKCELLEQKEKENRKVRRARREGAKAKAEGRARAKVPRTPMPLWTREINEADLVVSCFGRLVVGFFPPR